MCSGASPHVPQEQPPPQETYAQMASEPIPPSMQVDMGKMVKYHTPSIYIVGGK